MTAEEQKINRIDFPNEIFSEKLGLLFYLWDGMAIYCNKKFDMIYNLAGYSNKEGKEYYVKILKDGSYELFNGENKKDDVSKIGLVMGEKKIAIGLKGKGGYSLTNDNDDEECGKYYDNSIDAISDWDGEKNTEHIKSIGTDIPLDDGEFIPSVWQIGFINLFLKSVNEALKYVGGEKLEGYYWTSTEYSPKDAWYLYLGDGYLGWLPKAYGRLRVRAVSAFPL